MQVAKHKVVAIDYTLTDDAKQVIDSTDGEQPLHYLHGSGTIIPGLENELDGKSAGDHFNITIEPANGYGERNEELKQEVSRDQFEGVEDLAVGMQFRVDTPDEPLVVTVIDISDDIVTVDGNHQLAGTRLHFDVTVREVRDATDEEIDHGHVHGPGGHHH